MINLSYFLFSCARYSSIWVSLKLRIAKMWNLVTPLRLWVFIFARSGWCLMLKSMIYKFVGQSLVFFMSALRVQSLLWRCYTHKDLYILWGRNNRNLSNSNNLERRHGKNPFIAWIICPSSLHTDWVHCETLAFEGHSYWCCCWREERKQAA